MTPAPQTAMPAARPRARGQVGGLQGQPLSQSAYYPYTAADQANQDMGDWLPWIRSPDAEINQFRDRMVARQRDLVRNDGWAAGAIDRILDNTIGAGLRLSAAPDYRALARYAPGFDHVWAEEFRRAVESLWRPYAENYGRYNDVKRMWTLGDQQRMAFRHKLIDGEALAVAYWLPERVGYGRADYSTAFLVVDPDRLSNEYEAPDSRYMRAGVEIDDLGVPVAYWLRKAHQNDWYNVQESMQWSRVPREDEDGWQRVFHDFDGQRADQNRGVSILAPFLSHAKMLAGYYGLEMQAAKVATAYGTVIHSPYDANQVQEILDDSDGLSAYQELRSDFHKDRPLIINGVVVPTLAPGESIESIAAAHPHTGFADFAAEMLRLGAAATGLSAEQYSQAWFRTNYSSARAGLLESWKTLIRRRAQFASGYCTPQYACWLEEPMNRGELPLPKYAPDYAEARTAYSRCTWLGPGRGWVDPVKEPQGSVLSMDAGLSTLKKEAADNAGADWEEILDQRQLEIQGFKARGIDVPSWAALNVNAEQSSQPEEEPHAK